MNFEEFRSLDFTKGDIPDEVLARVQSIKVDTTSLTVSGLKIHTLQSVPSSASSWVVLLHGQAFSSKTWLELTTIQHIAAMGYGAVAVDLPGYGQSETKADLDKGKFLEELIHVLGIDPSKVTIVSPSMSGGFSIDYLKNHPDQLKGFIPVSPVNTEALKRTSKKACDEEKIIKKESIVHPVLSANTPALIPDLSCFTTPTMIVFGERDSPGFLRACATLNAMPFSAPAMIPKAGHACYRDNPKLWHVMLYNFLAKI